jgi:glucokinase
MKPPGPICPNTPYIIKCPVTLYSGRQIKVVRNMNVSSKSSSYLSIEIGGTKLQLIVFSEDAGILKRLRYDIDKEQGAAGIRAQIQDGVEQIKNDFTIVKTGVGFGGPVDRHSGVIGISHQVSGWSGFPLATWLTELTASPVRIENDANVAALGEATYGAGRGYETVFYMTIGSGVGGGLVQHGKLYHGRQQGESEIGHLRLNESGATVESLCAGWAVDAQIREAAAANPESIIASLLGDTKKGGEARYLLPALEKGCPVASQILENLVSRLSLGLSHVVHLFNPDVIILGGGVSLIGEPLREGVEKKLPSFVLKALQPVPKIAIAGLAEDVVPMGALALNLLKQD